MLVNSEDGSEFILISKFLSILVRNKLVRLGDAQLLFLTLNKELRH